MIFTIFLLLYILICHALCFRERSGWSLQICSNFSFWMSQCVENSSSQLVLLSSKLFSVVSILFIPLLCLVCIIYILCQQSLHTVRLNSHNTANRKNLTTRSHRLFQGNSNCKGVLCLSLKCDKSSHWVKDKMMCWLNLTHLLCMTNRFTRTSFTFTD